MLPRSLTAKRFFSNVKKTPGDYVLPTAHAPPRKVANEEILLQLENFHFEYKPLVICGSFCSGKSATIDHLRYTYDKMTYIAPYSTQKHFYNQESPGVDYIKAKASDFDDENKEWLVIEKHTKPQNALKDELYTGIKVWDVVHQSKDKKISMIEISSLETAQTLYEEGLFNMNYIYIMPADMEQVRKRIIRERVGTETGKTLEERLKQAEKEIQKAKQADWISKIFVNDYTNKHYVLAANYIHKDLYGF
jgi:guanylate kinase